MSRNGYAAADAAASVTILLSEGGLLHLPKKRRIANRRLTLALAAGSLLLLIAIVLAGRIVEPQAMVTDFSQKNLAPSLQYLFGTDWMGREMLARTLAGLSMSILIGLAAAGASSLIALALGAVAALGGRRPTMPSLG